MDGCVRHLSEAKKKQILLSINKHCKKKVNLHPYPFELKLNQHKEYGQCHDHIQNKQCCNKEW